MEFITVKSSWVAGVLRNSKGNLEVLTKDNRIYEYAKVSITKFNALLKAESVGQFINFAIKPAHKEVKR